MEEIIELLEVKDGLPMAHHAAKLVVGTLAGLVAGEFAKKFYVMAFNKLHSK